MIFIINTQVGVPDEATPQVSGQGSRFLLSMVLALSGSPEAASVSPARGEKREGDCVGEGFMGQLPCPHAADQREAGQWRPACAPGGWC